MKYSRFDHQGNVVQFVISQKKTEVLAVLLSMVVILSIMQQPPGSIDFFRNHGLFFLIFISLFPRLTLLFSSVTSGGLIWWLGFFFCPRVLVASLATVAYFQTNHILVFVSWVIAFMGEVFEKTTLKRRSFVFKNFKSSPHFYYHFRSSSQRRGENQGYTSQDKSFHRQEISGEGDVIEAEFTKKNE